MNIFQRLTKKAKPEESAPDTNAIKGSDQNVTIIQNTLKDFDITTELVQVDQGPSFTSYAFRTKKDIDVARVSALEVNLALGLGALSVRVIPSLGDPRQLDVEVPNAERSFVSLYDLVADSPKDLKDADGFEIVLGKNVAGKTVTVELADMANVMIAGQTGSGKSAMLNNILVNLLSKNSPQTLRLMLIDPKQVEFSLYDGIPHLLRPVIKSPEEWDAALDWTVQEMSRRLQLFAESEKKDIYTYNASAEEPLPRIVIVTDEFSDMMMVNGKKTERLISEIAQKSLLTGIHMIISTSRPSVDVYTGVARAAFPTRMAFVTATAIDSTIILDEKDAEKLLGRGDLLLRLPNAKQPVRLQAAYVSDDEVERFVNNLRTED